MESMILEGVENSASVLLHGFHQELHRIVPADTRRPAMRFPIWMPLQHLSSSRLPDIIFPGRDWRPITSMRCGKMAIPSEVMRADGALITKSNRETDLNVTSDAFCIRSRMMPSTASATDASRHPTQWARTPLKCSLPAEEGDEGELLAKLEFVRREVAQLEERIHHHSAGCFSQPYRCLITRQLH